MTIPLRIADYGGYTTGSIHELAVTLRPAIKGKCWAEIDAIATVQDFAGADVCADFDILAFELPNMDGGPDISVTAKNDPAAFAVLKAGVDQERLIDMLARVERDGERDHDT